MIEMYFELFLGLYLIFSVTFGDDCFVLINGIPSYNGTVNTTESGIACQRWDATFPHKPKKQMTAEHENYCRNPDNDDVLWCYTMDPGTKRGKCDIPECCEGTLSKQETTTVVTDSNTCECPCKTSDVFWIHFLTANLTEEERINIVTAEKQRLRQMLLVKKADLNSYTRSRTSAGDDRISAQSIGILGIIILCVVSVLFILADCSRCANYFN